MSNDMNLDDIISQAAAAQPVPQSVVAVPAQTALAVASPAQQYSIDDYLNETAGEVSSYLKITKMGVAIKEDNFTDVILRVKLADLAHGGSFRPFHGLNNSDGGSQQIYAKSFDRGTTIGECSDPAYNGRPWFDYVQMRAAQFPKNKPFAGVSIRGEVVKATGIKGAKLEEGTVVGYSGTLMTSKPINAVMREINAKGWAGEDVLVELSGKEATGNNNVKYAMPTLRLIGLDDGTLEV